MSRPGFVLEVDEKTPALLTMAGANLRLERFGLGTNVAYPAEPVPSTDPVALIDATLETPVGATPLHEQLGSDTRLTIVVLDNERPEPRMRFDVRRTIVERVLEHAARAGVDDVRVVIATGLDRRWNSGDISDVLGHRVATSFIPDGLITSHDITGPDLVDIGEVDGHVVRINRRVVESDVVVTVGVIMDDRDACGFTLGLTDVATINRMEGLHRDPEVNKAIVSLVQDKVPNFAITAVLGQPLLGSSLSFLNRREWEWGLRDQFAFAAARQFVAAFPKQGSQKLFGAPHADYAISDLVGGDPGAVAVQARDAWRAANTVEVPDTIDVLSVSVWGGMFDHGNPGGSPLNAAMDALVVQSGAQTGTPLVREGGIVVARHPLGPGFSNRTQSATADLFATVLPETLDPAVIAERWEPVATDDPWYVNLYRERFANHPLKAFHTWYRIRAARERLADVIWVGANRRTAALMGDRAASTFSDALEIASNFVGPHPNVLHLHGPGRVLGVTR